MSDAFCAGVVGDFHFLRRRSFLFRFQQAYHFFQGPNMLSNSSMMREDGRGRNNLLPDVRPRHQRGGVGMRL